MKALRVAGVVLNAILVIAYPVAVYWGLTHLGARAVSVMVLGAMVPGLAWRFRRAEPMENGENILEYGVRLRKGLSRDGLVSALTTQGAPFVVSAEFVEDDDGGGE